MSRCGFRFLVEHWADEHKPTKVVDHHQNVLFTVRCRTSPSNRSMLMLGSMMYNQNK